MRPALAWLAAGLMSATAFAAWWLSQTPTVALETKLVPTVGRETPAMCPWREPKADLARFFAGQTVWRQEAVVLSPYRLEILKRLPDKTDLESNVLSVYRVGDVGTVLVRRFSGEFGAIEAVIAVDPERHIRGVRVQRHREPASEAKALDATEGFVGKGPEDPLPQNYPPLAKAVHAELVAFDVAERHRTRP